MLVTTHAVVASTIAIKTGNPYIYLPFAAADHFILDTFPHFGGRWLKKNYRLMVVVDAMCGIALFLILARYTKFSVLILFIVCFLAGWPDLLTFLNRTGKKKRFTGLQNFHDNIQKLEFPLGIFIEFVIVLGCLMLIFV